ncbi:MAG TPA: DUF2238 domain-containing protein [Candidatus Nanoarchaeia archaeon]|nr:DUF2238 domain-containing protein [Candidatus Nanoarchaeia archaeon]
MKKEHRYPLILFFIFLLFWTWAAINPKYPDGWLIENYLVFAAVPLIILSYFYLRLSNISYTLITAFMCLHVIGSHYTYAEVPFGYTLQAWFGSERNMYDRLVHFCYGLLFAYPIRELFLRIAKVKGFWGYYLPVEITFAFSALYEIIEWLGGIYFDPNAGLRFVGAQGDIWDAQKDMALAGIGSTITMLIVLLINLSLDKSFKSEFKQSFSSLKKDAPLGEQKIAKLLKQYKKK